MKVTSRRFAEIVLLVGGVACLGVWGWSTVRGRLYEDWHSWIFDQQQTGKGATVGDYVKDRLTGSERAVPEETEATPALRGRTENGLIGRLSIPRLDLQAMVREGTGEKTLSLALGHIAGTARPGQN